MSTMPHKAPMHSIYLEARLAWQPSALAESPNSHTRVAALHARIHSTQICLSSGILRLQAAHICLCLKGWL